MCHAHALLRCVNAVEETVALSQEVTHDKQQCDELCEQYRHYQDFWTDERGILYRQVNNNSPQIVIPRALVPIVLKHYHDSLFTAHQGVGRTAEFIKQEHWWESLNKDVREYIKTCDARLRRKTGKVGHAPLGDATEA